MDEVATLHADMVSLTEKEGVLELAFGTGSDAPGDAPYLLLQRTLAPSPQDRQHGMDQVYVEWSSQSRSTYGKVAAAQAIEGKLLVTMDATGAEMLGVRRIEVTFDSALADANHLRHALDRLLRAHV
jgi:hypothetical protein